MQLKIDPLLIEETYEAFKYDNKNITELMQAVESGNSDTIRSIMDDSTDILLKDILQEIGEGEEGIHNARVKAYKKSIGVYSKYMLIINNELDNWIIYEGNERSRRDSGGETWYTGVD